MRTRIIHQIADIPSASWNGLQGGVKNPFIRYEFLHALEQHGCVGEKWGWHPRHLLLEGDDGTLLGAMPLYLKDNSYGELVFDWSWADAYQRAGLKYYPKLVSAVPYSPVTGPRLLLADSVNVAEGRSMLLASALQYAENSGCSSFHLLFPNTGELSSLESSGMMRRTGTQFHWFNRGYADFEAFLETFISSKRKKLKRERRRVKEQGVETLVLDGHQAGEQEWQAFYRFYLATYDKHWGYATLSEAFFRQLGESLPDNVVLMLAKHEGEYVAGALSLRSDTTLYGRHWGCLEEFHSLHFELCYYQGIDYCIKYGLERFEPGAQGEHKVSRGFEPVPTWSAHWLANPQFAAAVKDYLKHEEGAMQGYMDELKGHLPFKREP